MKRRPSGLRCFGSVLAHTTLLLPVLLLATISGTARAIEPGSPVDWTAFPVPPTLEPAVEFWTRVFAHYDNDQWVLHDEERLDVVWTVVDGEIPGTKSARRRVAQEVDRLRKTLRKLSAKGPDPVGLDEREAAVLEIARTLGGPKEWKAAAERIRVQAGMKSRFAEGVRRSGLYAPGIRAALEANGVPAEIAALPHVESSYNLAANSKVGAAGIWQFMRATGQQYMAVNADLDERRDPVRATAAAARYLRASYAEFGNWPLAITSYNHGQNGIRRAILQTGSRDLGVIVQKYRSKAFGFASRNFYAEFVAVLRILERGPELFPGVAPSAPLECAEVPIRHYLNVKDVIRTYGVPETEFHTLNPALSTTILRGERRIPAGYTLRLPVPSWADPDSLYAMIPPSSLHVAQIRPASYTVRRGDTLSLIAKRCGTTAKKLATLNKLKNVDQLRVGQKLVLPSNSQELALGR